MVSIVELLIALLYLGVLDKGHNAGAETWIGSDHRGTSSADQVILFFSFKLIFRTLTLCSRLSTSLVQLDNASPDDRGLTAENYVHSQYPSLSVPWLIISIWKLTADLPLVSMSLDSPWKAPTIPNQVDDAASGTWRCHSAAALVISG